MCWRGRDDAAARDVLYSAGQKEERSEVNLHGDGGMMIMNMMMMSCKSPRLPWRRSPFYPRGSSPSPSSGVVPPPYPTTLH